MVGGQSSSSSGQSGSASFDINNLTPAELVDLKHLWESHKSTSSDRLNGNTPLSSWIVDTWASCHMSGCLSHFTNIREITPLSVSLPNGDLTQATKCADIFLSSRLILKDVLYAPNLQCHLISVSSLLLDDSLIIQFSQKLCLIQDRSSRILIGVCEQREGLYYLKGVRTDEVKAYSGKYSANGSCGSQYFLTIVDDFSRSTWVKLL
ncbi:uncharacterized protein LOC141601140 [Silene latifolia]|uniref:uncharacterized protein LOC141601140 n=1 Tax=Silene latifolia TaxID=37657 RepID=UPI003D76D98E